MIIENSYVETVSGKWAEGYALDDYKTEIGIVLAREWEGNVFAQWGYKQIGKKDEKKPSDKALPMRIFLGNRTQAIVRLLEMAVLLGWQPKAGTVLPPMNATKAEDGQPEPTEPDVPF